MATIKEVSEVITELMSVFTEFKPANPAVTVKVYARALEDVPADALRLAVDDWLDNEKWFPKPAELRAHARLGKQGHWKRGEPAPMPDDDSTFTGIFMILPDGWKPFDVLEYRKLCNGHAN